ncbi:LacI family DNA-binding transcriptional regulator [uncultured Pseudokineococcus sp.]|uniref:LacI family DNA-binding transcriptional regulator n=1 Tax=uncultured Pseudokineococcus sp. TaxID=1642928 RepID=UPI00260E3BB9|nr:LacI family DNA-binding transcriptional regulator [uncultured Pseudokineococcus sp.]
MEPAGPAASAGRTRPVRIVDVAALAGVAPGTASKALSGSGQLRAETRERVRRAADQLGFVPDGVGRALSSGRSFTVGLLTTDSIGRFTLPVVLGVEDALGAGDVAVLLCDTRDDPLRERHHLRSLASRRVDGIVVTGRRTDPRTPVSADVPVVYAFQPSRREEDTSVVVDERGGAVAALAHLLALGRTRVAHITGSSRHAAARSRAEAVVDAAASAGRPLVVDPLHGAWSEEWGRRAVDLLVRQVPDVDAVSCGSDQIARGVVDRLRELGRTVPDDVAVTGFDDWDVMALASRPPLTTVGLQMHEVGRTAARLLLEAVDGRPQPGTVVLPTHLVVRGSTVA